MAQTERALWRQVRAERKKRDFVFWTLILLTLLYIAMTMVFGDMGYLKFRKLRGRSLSIKTQIARVRQENGRMRASLEEFKQNDYYKEKQAREDYGLSKQDEYIFLFQNRKK
ncbi:MAG: septum formation initiator family protein [Nitrospiraceae bacterium]|nr:septum formation initiator family protein [Nitrospiraceae bacterium]